jgi:hypothetical protein
MIETRCLHCGGDAEPGSPVPLCRRDVIAVHDYWQERDDMAARILRGEGGGVEAAQLLRAARRPQPKDERGHVYYIRLGDRVKIGWSANVTRRISELPTEQLLAVEPGDRQLERDRHVQFIHLSAAGREWFRLAPDLLAHVTQLRHLHGDPPGG